MGNAIEIRSLTKRFGNFTAVDRINLNVREGEIFGFLGPNGAGKTTTISMLTTLIKPTSGTALVGGHDILTEGVNVRSIIGVVPQSFSLFPELTAEENLTYIGKLYGMESGKISERSEELLKTVELFEHRTRIAGIFSGGMKQRLSLAASIMSSPKILFMDEPTTGLDPQSRIAIRELTKRLNSEGMTIVYTTHDMDEAEKVCDRITVMDKGKIIADGTSRELKRMITKGHIVEVEIDNPGKEIVRELQKLPFVTRVTQSASIINLTVKNKEGVFYKLSDYFCSKKQRVVEIKFKEPTLEDVFIQLTSKELRDK
ncbi:MAG: ATP-binding cassette domain-containing protein [Candidatus Woesearchaeota archaeon]